MTSHTWKGARWLALGLLVAALSACGLPRSGPTKSEIFAGSVLREGDAYIVAVNDRVTRATAVVPALGFSDTLRTAGRLGSDIINPGDVLTLTIYENVAEGLLAAAGETAAVLNEVQVDGEGFIFVPYAGRIRAAGNTPEQLRQEITRQLDAQTPDPQVAVRRVPGDGSTVSIQGAVAGSGVYPIERPTRTLAAMLARAGGVTIEPELAQVTVTRGNQQGRVWLVDLYDHPSLDIALRNNDRILVREDSRSFVALGATGAQSLVPFRGKTLSAVEAIAQVGGLNPNAADPTGVFVFRNEPAAIANAVLGRTDLVGDQRFAYVLDLTQPTGMFMARDFVIRDGDTVYVTEAPSVSWQRAIATITGQLRGIDEVRSLATGN